jgi:hypothetical protein
MSSCEEHTKDGPSALELGVPLTLPHRKNYAKCHKGSRPQKALVNKVMTFWVP